MIGKKKIFFLLALTSCHGACGNKSSAPDDASADASLTIADAATLAPARCNTVTHRATLGSPLDIGEVVTTNDGFALGLVREDNVLSVALVSNDLSKISYADIGRARVESAPPQPFLWGNSVYVAWMDSGALRVGRIDNGKVAMIDSVVVDPLLYDAKDPVLEDLPGFDVAVAGDHAAVVWDFADAARGHVRFISFSKNGFDKGDGGIPFVDVAPVTSDADSPRIAPRAGGGYWGIWVARKAEPPTDASAIEGPGETPTLRWLEAAPLDEHGTRVGAVVKLTPDSGHVGGYDVVSNAEGTDVVVRDVTESADEGTSLFRTHLSESAAPADLFASEIGRAEPDVVSTPIANGSTLSWTVTPDMNDATRIIPLLKGGTPPLPSVEPTLKSARALALRTANSQPEMLAMHALSVAGSPDQAEIMLISCGSP